jgi:hypothetical protein
MMAVGVSVGISVAAAVNVEVAVGRRAGVCVGFDVIVGGRVTVAVGIGLLVGAAAKAVVAVGVEVGVPRTGWLEEMGALLKNRTAISPRIRIRAPRLFNVTGPLPSW